jgi:methionyl-tRNA formyltransferase
MIPSSPHRIVFFGTPQFAVPTLEMLLTHPFPVVGIVTQPDRPSGRKQMVQPSPIKEIAIKAHQPLLQPDSFRLAEALDALGAWKPTLGIVVAYGNLLPKAVLELFPAGIVNLHPSLLPNYRGPSPIQTAMLHGDDITGITVMQLDPGMDSGPIYGQTSIRIEKRETAGSLRDRLAVLGASFLEKLLPEILQGSRVPTAQDDSLATFTKLLTKEDGSIDWSQPATQIDRHIRALAGWPGAWTAWESADQTKHLRVRILEGMPVAGSNDTTTSIGAIESDAGAPLAVQSGRGTYVITKLQQEGKQVLTSEAFLRGRPAFRTGRFISSLR